MYMLSNFSGINTTVTQGVWDPTKTFMIEFKGKDENYGKPPEGSLTEARAKKACRHINKELTTLLCIIRGIGSRDEHSGEITVPFGKLFKYYIPISNKVVGLLLRARRWRLVEFPGEMLYQGQDDNVIIRLTANEDLIPYSRRFDFSLDTPTHQTESAAENDLVESQSEDDMSCSISWQKVDENSNEYSENFDTETALPNESQSGDLSIQQLQENNSEIVDT